MQDVHQVTLIPDQGTVQQLAAAGAFKTPASFDACDLGSSASHDTTVTNTL